MLIHRSTTQQFIWWDSINHPSGRLHHPHLPTTHLVGLNQPPKWETPSSALANNSSGGTKSTTQVGDSIIRTCQQLIWWNSINHPSGRLHHPHLSTTHLVGLNQPPKWETPSSALANNSSGGTQSTTQVGDSIIRTCQQLIWWDSFNHQESTLMNKGTSFNPWQEDSAQFLTFPDTSEDSIPLSTSADI